ncbi:MAG: response regulator [Lachnospiraceae bacterium]|jgi:signal transduction histidine kinase/ActR/RegA family two-component response regulator|nr:response regulator [Lachnospiraceae bacterium]
MATREVFEGFVAGTMMEDRTVRRKRMIVGFGLSFVCALIIILMRATNVGLFFYVGNMAFSVSDFFIILPSTLLGAQYGVAMFFLIFAAEIFRLQSLSEAYALFIYIVISIIPGYLAHRRWLKSFAKTLLLAFIVSMVLGGFWYVTFVQLTENTANFYEVMGPATIFISAMPETFAAIIIAYLILRYLPDSLKKYVGYGFVYTKGYDAYADSKMGRATSSLGDRIMKLSLAEAVVLSASAALFSNRQMRKIPISEAGEVVENITRAAPDSGHILMMNIQLAMLIMCVALPVAMLFNERLHKLVVQPLSMLSAGLEFYTDEDEMRHHAMETIRDVPIKSKDEIASLRDSLVGMLERMDMYVDTLRREEELKVNLKSAEAKSEAKSVFLSSMSHEIRTPINAVLGMNEMILRESNEKDTLEYAENIKLAGNTLLNLVNDILDFSKIEAGKMDIIETEYETFSVIHDLITMVSQRAETKGLELITKIDSNLPCKLYGDEIRIKQAITNILTNAVKYTEEGSVTFTISFEKEGEDTINLFVSVKDTGIGIKEEDLGKLNSAFERIEEERNRNIEGTGLGMAITTTILNMMGSELKVDSVYGEGSDFYFNIKQRIVDAAPIGDVETAWRNSLEKRTAYRSRFMAPTAKILAVDDVPMNLSVLTGLLKPTKVIIDTADSGQECLDKITNEHYDIIFLDHRMPEMDGVETRERMDTLPGNMCKDTPVIALTANAAAGAKEEYISYGFTDYLTKPIDADDLEKMMQKYIPEEKLELYEEEIDISEEDKGVDKDEYPVIDGLDMNFAKLHLPTKDLLEESIKSFYGIIDLHGDRLDEMYTKLPSKEGFAEYRVQVHGMKSSAATIGIVPLAGCAKMLEDAAGAEDLQTIQSLHGPFINLWKGYKSRLEDFSFIEKPDAGEKEEFDKSIVLALLDMVKISMEDFDVDRADEAIAKLSVYSMNEELSDKLSRLKAAVADVNDEESIRTADEMINIIGGIS